jgi:hypothetical protein
MATVMPRRWAALLALVFLSVQVSAFAQDRSAETFLRSIYGKAYLGKNSDGIDISTRAKLDRYFVPQLVAKIEADIAATAKSGGGVGELDVDPFIDAQDWQIESFDINVRNDDASNATGTIRFSNLGTPMRIVVSLKRLKTGWRIQDIDWGESGKLSALFH